MKLNVTKDILEAMINYGDNSPELEVCGALVGKSDESSYTCTEFIPLTNRSNKNKAVHYIPDQNEFFNVLKRTTHFDSNSNLDLVGIFHTHPHHAPIPSETDILGAGYAGIYVIYSPKLKEIKSYYYDGQENTRFFSPSTILTINRGQTHDA
tara:strand:- start:163 stop:618 length:456 start_codon:yes stop_codon:yes gene_type:complete